MSRYHFIRTKVGEEQEKTLRLFKEVFGEDMEYILYDSKNTSCLDEYLGNGNDIEGKKPEKHTFVFLKEMARCAKTFSKIYIGVWYERHVNCFNDDVVIQGFLGRATGYDDNGDSIVFTNIDSIERYIDLWNSDFSDDIKWNSNSTNYSEKNKKQFQKTFNAEISDGKENSDDEKDEPIIVKFNGKWNIVEKDIRKFLKSKNLGRIMKKSPNDEGFYIGNIRNTSGILTTDFVEKNKGSGLNDETKKRVYPCYTDITDSSTIQWWVIYHDTK